MLQPSARVALLIASALSMSLLSATSYNYVGPATSTWNTNANWNPNSGFPGSSGTTDVAGFSPLSATTNLTLTSPVTISALNVSSLATRFNLTLTGSTITFSSGGSVSFDSGFSTVLSMPPIAITNNFTITNTRFNFQSVVFNNPISETTPGSSVNC